MKVMTILGILEFLIVYEAELTFKAVVVVRLKNVSSRTFTIITPCCVGTVMGTPSIVSETLVNFCDNINTIVIS